MLKRKKDSIRDQMRTVEGDVSKQKGGKDFSDKERKRKDQGEIGKFKNKNKGDKWIILLPRSSILSCDVYPNENKLGAYFVKTPYNCGRFFSGPTSNGHPGWNL